MKCRGIQCFDFLLAKKLVGFQWRAGTTPSPGAAAKCCKAATSECMKSSPGYRWHPSFTVPKWCQKFIKKFSYIMNMQRFPCLHSQLLTAWILIIANNGFLTGCTLECLTMLSKSSPETASKKNFWARHKHFSTAWREGVENQIRFSSAPNTPPNRAEKRYKLQDVRI